MLGYYVLQTYGTPRQRQYQFDFSGAQWIEPAESPAPIAYFRKEVYLPALPENAWLQIQRADNFGLTVNGRTVGNLYSVKSYETNIYDIKSTVERGDERYCRFHFPHLLPGRAANY